MKHNPIRLKCTCQSEYQDQKYGASIRVGTPSNKSRKSGTLSAANCTVCGKTHNYNGG